MFQLPHFTSLTTTVTGATAGYQGEGKVATWLPLEKNKQILGRYVGAAVDTVVGGSLGLYGHIFCTEKTESFTTWQTEETKSIAHEAMNINYSDDEFPMHHVCPVSCKVMEMPTITLTENVSYDMKSIEDLIKHGNINEEDNIIDPQRNPPFAQNELRINYRRAAFIQK